MYHSHNNILLVTKGLKKDCTNEVTLNRDVVFHLTNQGKTKKES